MLIYEFVVLKCPEVIDVLPGRSDNTFRAIAHEVVEQKERLVGAAPGSAVVLQHALPQHPHHLWELFIVEC